MRFSKTSVSIWRLLVCLGCVYLSACSVNKAIEDAPLTEAQVLQNQQLVQQEEEDRQAFQQALQKMQATDAKQSDLENAKTVFDRLYQNNPAYLGALLNSADISYRLQRYVEAEAIYTKVVAQLENQITRPAQASAFLVHSLNQLALLAREKGRFEQAESFYRQALALEPSHPTVLRNLAILLDLYRGKLAEALVLYEQYQNLLDEPDAQVKDWIFDLKSRLPEENAHE